jgi:hypothetical protein
MGCDCRSHVLFKQHFAEHTIRICLLWTARWRCIAWPLVELTLLKRIVGKLGDVETEFTCDKNVFGGANTVLMYLVIALRWLLHRIMQQARKNSRIANRQCEFTGVAA